MSHHIKGFEQIQIVVLEALSRERGPVGMARLLQQFETGSGNYSTERHQLLDHLRIEDIAQQLQLHHKEQ